MGWRRLPGGAEVGPLLLLLTALACSSISPPAAQAEGRILLVHVTTLLDKDTARTGLVFRTAAAGLRSGHQVVLLFDAEGVGSLKMGRWFGGHSTPIDRVAIPVQDRSELASLLGTPVDGIPDIYGSLLHFLKGRGLFVYVSQQALELQGIGREQYDHAAEPVGEDRIVELAGQASVYLSY